MPPITQFIWSGMSYCGSWLASCGDGACVCVSCLPRPHWRASPAPLSPSWRSSSRSTPRSPSSSRTARLRALSGPGPPGPGPGGRCTSPGCSPPSSAPGCPRCGGGAGESGSLSGPANSHSTHRTVGSEMKRSGG